MRSDHDTHCSTKAGRERAIEALRAAAKRAGASFEIDEITRKPRDVTVFLGLGPFKLMLHLDGETKLTEWLGHWHTETSSRWEYPRDFMMREGMRGTINTFHYHKATTHAETFGDFLKQIETGFRTLKEHYAPNFIAVDAFELEGEWFGRYRLEPGGMWFIDRGTGDEVCAIHYKTKADAQAGSLRAAQHSIEFNNGLPK